jgi:light-regulated signal transduction histidine kinase (bacteriophytochrome)
LLGLARIARVTVRPEVVDLTDLAKAVVADLRQEQPDREVEVVIDDGMVARGDRALLRIVLVNLIGNAWKYTLRSAHPTIECRRSPDASDTFFVRDNGTGFDMAHADRLFAPFQRLHSSSEFEGTGIGLATVQRVIARHGGRVWAEAERGRGATFFFALSA